MLSERKTVLFRSEAHFTSYVNSLLLTSRAQTAVAMRARSHQHPLEESERTYGNSENKTPEVLEVCVRSVLENNG